MLDSNPLTYFWNLFVFFCDAASSFTLWYLSAANRPSIRFHWNHVYCTGLFLYLCFSLCMHRRFAWSDSVFTLFILLLLVFCHSQGTFLYVRSNKQKSNCSERHESLHNRTVMWFLWVRNPNTDVFWGQLNWTLCLLNIFCRTEFYWASFCATDSHPPWFFSESSQSDPDVAFLTG